MRLFSLFAAAFCAFAACILYTAAQSAEDDAAGSVFGSWRRDRPGLRHRITIPDLPPPYETRPAGNPPRVTSRQAGAKPVAPPASA